MGNIANACSDVYNYSKNTNGMYADNNVARERGQRKKSVDKKWYKSFAKVTDRNQTTIIATTADQMPTILTSMAARIDDEQLSAKNKVILVQIISTDNKDVTPRNMYHGKYIY